MDFDSIFGPGEFNEDEGTYTREFPGVEAGDTRNLLSFKVLKEHSGRHRSDFDPWPNGTSKDYELEKSNMTASIENFSSGLTTLKIDFSEDIEHLESYMEGSVDQWLGEIIRREQKAYRAATHYVHSMLPDKAEEEGTKPDKILEQELEELGDSIGDFHDFYRQKTPNDLAMNYATEFELWPHQDADMNRSDLPGKMPAADEIDDPELRERNDLYQRLYLEAVVEEADETFGISEKLKQQWLDYGDISYR